MRNLFVFLILLGAAVAGDEPRAPSGRDSSQPRPCVFCDIVAGKRQQEGIVYRDDKCLAFLSIGPRNPGHVLVVTLVHADNFLAVPADTMHAMTDAARKIAEAIRRTDLKCEGFVLQMNSGQAADQTVFHAHLHIIPRFTGEPPEIKPQPRVPMSELEPVAAKIRAALATPEPAAAVQRPQMALPAGSMTGRESVFTRPAFCTT